MAEVKKKAMRENRTIVFVDESAFYLIPGVVRSYAPQGHPAHLKVFSTHDHLSVMSGITPAGQISTLVRNSALGAVESVLFVQHLHHWIGTKLLVIWDGSPIHRGRTVTSFLTAGAAHWVHLERLPAYAPELNPDEAVWQHLKHVELANLGCQDFVQLRHEFHLAVMRLRSKPHLIKSFFQAAGLKIKMV
ncbi:MAG: transposase [Blastocatellia bacterium]|nr:transposase [Blastocatellia bacterium]